MRLLSRREAAALLAVPERTLADWAYRGEGPPYYRLGRHARYDEAELLRWLAGQRVGSAPGGAGGQGCRGEATT